MKKPFFSLPRQLPVHTLSTLCIGIGCSWPLMNALELTSPFSLCLCVCAGAVLLFAFADCMERLRPLSYPLLLLAAAAALVPYRAHTQAVSHALTLFLNGQGAALAAYSRPLSILLCLMLTGIGASLSRSEQSFFPLALLTVAELMMISFLGLDTGSLSLLPLMLALLLSMRMPQVTSPRILIMAAASLALTFSLLPFASGTLAPLSRTAEKARRLIDDYFFFTEPRAAFSLSSAGWQPLGQDRLGGSVSPTDDPVMQVKTPSRALLRGTVKNTYTGLAWQDTASSRRYLMISPRFASLRENLFDANRPDRSLLPLLPGSRTLDVTMMADSASTLFVTQRLLTPKGDGVVSYFSPSSEVFATRSLAAGDTYSFSGRLLSASSDGVRSAVLAAWDEQDPYYETIKNTYLQLPRSVEPAVYEITRELTASSTNAFDKAAALCLYLQRGFPYSLEQHTPPSNRDFVSWFLLEEKRGYCTSFASALCVLSRAAGLPSRYVEGYSAVPDADGVARVTQQDAHAWTEIYFPGFGWLSFDPTPGVGSVPDYGGSSSDQSAGQDDPSGEPGASENDASADSTPSPSPTPTPTPVPTPSPSPTPEHHNPDVTPTPVITPAPTPTPGTPPPTQPPTPDDSPDDKHPLLWLLLVLILLSAAAARFVWVSPSSAASRLRAPDDQLLIFFRAVEEALCAMGLAPCPGEAPASYLLRAQDTLGGKITLITLGKAVCVARYSGRRIKPSAVGKAQKTYRQLFALLTPMQKLRLFARRFVRGSKLH